MLNVVSNSSVAVSAPSGESSPLATLINNSKDANGQPVFAEIVRDALNRTTSNSSNAEGQQVPHPKSTDSAPAAQEAPNLFFVRAMRSEAPPASKQGKKQESQPSTNTPAIIQVLFSSALSVLSPSPLQNDQNKATSGGEPIVENTAATRAICADSSKQALTTAIDANGTLQFSAQLTAKTAAVPSVPPAASDGNATCRVDSPTSTNDKSIPRAATLESPATFATETAALAEVSSLAEASTSSSIAQTDGIAASSSAMPQKVGVVTQVSIASPNPQHGQSLAPVLQQVVALQGTTASLASEPSIMVDLARTASQSQLAQAAARTALTPPSIPRTLEGYAALAPSEAKSSQSASLHARAMDPAQNPTIAAAAANDHSSSKDSSSNHSGQNASDLSTPSDSFSSAVPPAKSQSSTLSDALSSASAPKLDAAQPAQATSTAVPALVMPLQAAEPSARSKPEALPSVTTQAQPPLPTMHAPDAPSGRFVNDAQLANAAGQSEMRIAMQTDKLGAIELHARVSGDEVGAAIIVEKRDAHAALAVELPALQQALSEKQLRVEQVALTHGSLGSTAGDGGATAQHNQRDASQPPRSLSFWNEARSLSTAAWFVPEQIGVFNAQGRLSVQA